jgi:hypothetical protein
MCSALLCVQCEVHVHGHPSVSLQRLHVVGLYVLPVDREPVADWPTKLTTLLEECAHFHQRTFQHRYGGARLVAAPASVACPLADSSLRQLRRPAASPIRCCHRCGHMPSPLPVRRLMS